MAARKTAKKKVTPKARFNTYVDGEVMKGIAEIANLINRSQNYVANEAYKAYINANLPELRKSLK